MEAARLPKKDKINKTKLKKTIRNVLCRPDTVFWPIVSQEDTHTLQQLLEQYKISIPEFTKLNWKDLKCIPKKDRPKLPKLQKVEGLIFGLSECKNAIQNNNCSAILIEATINPRIIVEPLIEACLEAKVPVLCLDGLKSTCSSYFGIPTSCLGVRKDSLIDLINEIVKISNGFTIPARIKMPINAKSLLLDIEMTDISNDNNGTPDRNISKSFYLYRKDKKSRVFTPDSGTAKTISENTFVGQDFIELSKEKTKVRHGYTKMILKRIANDRNRVGKKK